mmetsp:Transcript_15706/g.26484  ORF Transcript_15706/g.26484 Transcript_15706/m.26484 type:complete len:82 (+) Transcript_15706:390-635(+)
MTRGKANLFIYESGTDPADPLIDQKVTVNKVIDQGCGFGELALLYNDKRSATIVAESQCVTYALDGVLFKQMIVHSSMQKR